MKILVNQKDEVICKGYNIYRCNFQEEKNLIKINVNQNIDDYYYIGTIDRDDYLIFDVNEIPSDYEDSKYLYKNNNFILNENYNNNLS